ncbi:hypothetical protein BD310DRAFT_974219 [Dichomitus squalens]|uniref:DUF6533 domain-containing protein n=1 Tax=Dichomitus squalens TaxID=114155 RepID=A0A4Q9Q4U8_9APHY|nr:hypothetical protein BD310DRAFT_974219 [Dichomitus squalens]
MASNSEVQVAYRTFFANCWTFASSALLAYDYTLTFGNEVALFWTSGHKSGATVLFVLNRYITLAAQCMNLAPLPSSVKNTTVEVVTRSSLIASDLVVLYVTWYRTYATAKLSLREGGPGRKTFASIILLDGTMYFMTLLILNILHLSFTLTGVAARPYFITSVVALLEEPLTSILTSRFLINLQKAQRKLDDTSESVSLGEVAFQPQMSRNTSRFIGSLGAQLSFDEDDSEESEDTL